MSRTAAARGPQVTCRDCDRTWVPTREDSYYQAASDADESTTSGRCFACMLARVMNLTGGNAVPEPFDARGQRVTCRDCGRTYTCTPEEDYHGDPGSGLPDSATSGRCFACMLRAGGLNPETTPVMVINPAGRTDPRDLSRREP